MPHIVKPGFTTSIRGARGRTTQRKVIVVTNQGSITSQDWGKKAQTPVAVTRVASGKQGARFA